MLSRTAANLYWLSRMMERGENTARLLDASYTMSLMPRSRRAKRELAATLAITGLDELFDEHYESLDADALMEFFIFDERNPSSIFSSLRMARDNALSVRGELSRDVWESINGTWLELQAIRRRERHALSIKGFFEWITQQSHMFRGAVYGTTERNDTFNFMRLGTHIERADNTARILDVRYEAMKRSRSSNEAVDFYQWNALLQSLSAYEAYHERYKRGINDRNVAELLILGAEIPRSLRWCSDQIGATLEQIEGNRGMTAKRLAAELIAQLRYSGIDEIIEIGLHRYLTELLRQVNRVGSEVHRSYWQGQ